jgi:hypothetical protein
MRIFGEMRRRNVFKVSVVYVLSSWLLIRLVNSLTFDSGLADRGVQILTLLLILGFPVVILFAWAYEITPQGLKPTAGVLKTQSITAETGRKLNYLLLALIALSTAAKIIENFA